MAGYSIYRYNGSLLAEVPDGTIETSSTDLKLIGKNYPGYGTAENENFVHLLENFRSETQPRRPIIGQLWFDESVNKIKFRDHYSSWRTLAITDTGITKPSGLTTIDKGNLWFDEDRKQINVWDGTDFVLIGPENAPTFRETRMRSVTIRDDGNTAHPIIKVVEDGSVVAVWATDSFAVGTIDTTLGAGFTYVHKGLTLIDTPADGVTTSDYRFWGTATNSVKLGGHPLSDFVLRGLSGSTFDDYGFTVGNDSDIRIFVEDTNKPVISNQLGTTLRLRVTVGTTKNDIGILSASGISPGLDNSYDIGDVTHRYRNIYGANIFGGVVGTLKGNMFASDSSLLIDGTTKSFIGTTIGTHQGDLAATNGSPIFDGLTKALTVTSVAATTINANTVTLVDKVIGNVKGSIYANDETIAYNSGTKTFTGSLAGNADTASRLVSGKYINGVLFDGTTNIDVNDPLAVAKSGSVMSGYLTLVGDPTAPGHAATKLYVDNQLKRQPLFFSIDTKGLDTAGSGVGSVVALMNELAPVGNFLPGTLAHITSTIQNIQSTVALSTARWISINYVRDVTVTTTQLNPTRNNLLIYRVNSSGTSWEYVSG
jgi:hypothetical protein